MYNIAVCFSSDSNYVRHMAACMASVLKSKNEDEFIKFYVIDGGIEEGDKENLHFFEENFDCSIKYVKPDLEKLKNCKISKSDYISFATYYRLLIPEIIPEEDRIIYLDCDVIVRKPLRTFYEEDFGDNLVLGVVDVSLKAHTNRLKLKKYVNAGVLLFNNKGLREGMWVDKMFDWMQENKALIECHDQDIINAALKGWVGYAERSFGAQVQHKNRNTFEKMKDPAILHFISPHKPWTLWKPLDYTRWEKEYYKAIENTPFEKYAKKYKMKSKLMLPLRFFYPSGIIKYLIRKIFSIRNSDDRSHKIMTIFFFKIKYKKEKLFTEDSPKKLLCHLHLHYVEQLDYFLSKLENIKGIEWDLFVTSDVLTKEIEDKIKAYKTDAKFFLVENRGYDVLPFINLIKSVDLSEYEYVLKLHTKNSDRKGSFAWRDKLTDAILMDRDCFDENITLFEKDKETGMIVSGKYFVDIEGDEPENSQMLEDEIKRINFKTKERKYLAGTIFLARAKVFEILNNIDIDIQKFPTDCPSHGLGTMAHVWERILTLCVFEKGYKVHTVLDFCPCQKVLEFFFSLKNSKDKKHKIITICGIKIKIKR